MKCGSGEESYANNSSLQRKAITIAKPIIEAAIKDVYIRLSPKTLCVSDLGCSTGPNTFYAISVIMEAVDHVRQSLGHESPEFLIQLNDLPNNDFNTLFKSLSRFQDDMGCKVGPCFINGVPGSFFDRLFPYESLHFVHSSQSVHWLSHVPGEAKDNKGNIYISTPSPPNVVNAYVMQFNKNFTSFLGCRAVELVAGGCMVLTLIGRRQEDPGAWESQSIWGPLATTIKDMVNEGLIEKEKLDSFNVPIYFPSIPELKALVEEEGSFIIRHMGLADVHWNGEYPELSTPDSLKSVGLNVAKFLRAICEPLLASHFGEFIIDEMFRRFAKIVCDCMSKEKTTYLNVTISLKKRD